jgi:rhamnose transport system ATP-binding protein
MSTPTIELVDIHKAFGSTRVLDGVSLSLMPGEVHSLVGENGAGKSTLVKIMAGVHLPDGGIVKMNGRDVFLRSTAQAQQAGVSVIYQEPSLFRDLSVAENVYMHRQPKTAYGWIDYAAMHRSVAQHLNQLGVSLRPDDPVLGLSIADQQMVEIIKALTFEAKVLIMMNRPRHCRLRRLNAYFKSSSGLGPKGSPCYLFHTASKKCSPSHSASRSCGMEKWSAPE